MFEKYTERARRVLFFARYEASQLGSVSIDTDHLLLGLIREGRGLTNRLFADAKVSLEDLRKEIEGRAVFREKVSTSVEMPFTADARRVLELTAKEADRLGHNYIGTEHLLLGLLREARSPAAASLLQRGMNPDTLSARIVQIVGEGEPSKGAWESRPCCFCGQNLLDASFAVWVHISRATDEGGSQGLYAHIRCLRERVRPDLPLLTDTDEQ